MNDWVVPESSLDVIIFALIASVSIFAYLYLKNKINGDTMRPIINKFLKISGVLFWIHMVITGLILLLPSSNISIGFFSIAVLFALLGIPYVFIFSIVMIGVFAATKLLKFGKD